MKSKQQQEDTTIELEAAQAEVEVPEETGTPEAGAEPEQRSEELDLEELQAELEQRQADLEEQKEAQLRLAAEYENFRRRSRQEKEDLYAKAQLEVSSAWLPVIDNLERAMASLENETGEIAERSLEGIRLVFRQAQEVLQKLGIEEIPSLGETFDPNLHEAVFHVEDESFGQEEIVEVFQKGYRKGEQVLRHSVVKVAN